MPERDNGATAGRDQNAVRTRSEELRKELSIADLAFAQTLFIVGLQWVGVAAKQRPAHVIFWLIAIALFYLPSAVVLPIIPVGSRTLFAIKIAGLIVVTNLVGVAVFVSGRRRAHAERVTVGQSR